MFAARSSSASSNDNRTASASTSRRSVKARIGDSLSGKFLASQYIQLIFWE